MVGLYARGSVMIKDQAWGFTMQVKIIKDLGFTQYSKRVRFYILERHEEKRLMCTESFI